MIICQEKKIVFIKTVKTAGTSFEIALSRFCGDACIITPITAHDEAIRSRLGFRSAQNFIDYFWASDGWQTSGKFFNHIAARDVRRLIPARVWRDYKKVALVRNPFDTAISRYFWIGGERIGLSFLEYLKHFPEHLRQNAAVAPIDGECQLDFYLKYEELQSEFDRAGLGFMWETFDGLRAKGNRRPKFGTTVEEMYERFPEAIGIIEVNCGRDMNALGYSYPRS
jgi:hypothetical protein